MLRFRVPSPNIEEECVQKVEHDIGVDTSVVLLRHIVHLLHLGGANWLGTVHPCDMLRRCDNMSRLLHGQQIDNVSSPTNHD